MATLKEVSETYALDQVFSEYPSGATIDDLEQVANNVSVFTEAEDWILWEQYEELGYVSADAILQTVFDKAWEFRIYYERVDVS